MKRNRRLSDAEYAQLGAALDGRITSDIFLFLAVTGWRSGEAKNLRFDECDLERNIATLGDTKTGLSIRPLSGAAIDIIKRQGRASEYVFASEHGKPYDQSAHHLAEARNGKGRNPTRVAPSLRVLAADLGFADSTIAGLIGHKQQSITSRYLHLDKTLIIAADKVAAETLKLMHS